MNTNSSKSIGPDMPGSHLSKGQISRTAILLAAAKLATTRGLDGLSIGDLAAEVGMSKSGLYAHFKSKEDLELATIETAADIFDREVLQRREGACGLTAGPGTGRFLSCVSRARGFSRRMLFRRGGDGTGFASRPGPRPSCRRATEMAGPLTAVLPGCAGRRRDRCRGRRGAGGL